MTTPRKTLCAIFTRRAPSPSPTYVTPRPQVASSGSAASKAARGPEAATVSLPAPMTLGLPLTGAARNCTPSASALARTRAETSGDTVEESTTILGLRSAVSSPRGPAMTASRSLSAETMMNTMSRPARSAGLSTIFAPNSVRGSHLALVRL